MRRLLFFVVATCAVAVLGTTTPHRRVAAAFQPTFEDAACPMPLPEGQLAANVRCGYLTVAETHGKDDGRTLKLAVAVLKSTSAHPEPDPVVYVTGGPGAPALEGEFQGLGQAQFASFIQSKRDFIFFDQRGTGHSQPLLNCPETAHVLLDTLAANRTAPQDRAANNKALLACRDRLLAAGVNLAAYNSAESARDIADLITALGYKDYNLYGTSYGPRLELTTMRDVPAHIRSVILDSPLAVQANVAVDQAADLERSLREVFDSCAAQKACHDAYPNFEQQFWDVIDRANAHPIEVTINDEDGKPIDIKISGDRILNGVFVALYNDSTISVLPLAADAIYNGNYGIVTLLAQQIVFAFSGFADAMSTSVNCSEELPFITTDVLRSATRGVRKEILDAEVGITTEASRLDNLALCAQWGTRVPSARENQAVASSIPTLVLDGQFDPITPPRYGPLAAQKLSRSFVYLFPTSGHGVTYEQYDCASAMIGAFLDAPTSRPDSSCIAKIAPLDFVIGESSAATPTPPPAPSPTTTPMPSGITGPNTGTAAANAGGGLLPLLLLAGAASLLITGVCSVLIALAKAGIVDRRRKTDS